LTGGTPDRETVIVLFYAYINGGNLYSKELLNFNERFIGTSLMKKGALFLISIYRSL